MRHVLILALVWVNTVGSLSAASEDSLKTARSFLEAARARQEDALQRLSDLNASRDRAGSAVELQEALQAVHQMQLAVTRSARAMVARTFGQKAGALSEDDRVAIEQIAVDQRGVLQRWNDWREAFRRYTGGEDVPEGLRQLSSRAADSSAGEHMEEAAGHVDAVHLSQAADSGQDAADELARLGQAMEAATSSPDELVDRFIRLVKEIVDQEKNVRERLATESPDKAGWQLLRREQSDIGSKARVLTFPEAAVVPGTHELLRSAYELMRSAERQIAFRKSEEAGRSLTEAIDSLEEVVAIAESLGEKDFDLVAPGFKPMKPKKPEKAGGMPAGLGAPGGGIDRSAIAQLAADISLVVKLRKNQTRLYRELSGRVPATPATKLAVGRQRQYAASVPQLVRRAELYGPTIAPILEEVQASMAASLDRLIAKEPADSLPHQEKAIERLLTAETEMRGFYKLLMEALELISAPPAEGAPHGRVGGEEEKAKMSALLAMLRQIVRIAGVVKDMHVLVATTEGWIAAGEGDLDQQAVAAAAAKQRALSKTGFDIFNELKKLPGDVTESLPEKVLEASQWMEGAANGLDKPDFKDALKWQVLALEFLESSWEIMAFAMSTLATGEEGSDTEQRNDAGDTSLNPGGDTAVTAVTAEDSSRPWYWELPPRARAAVTQSLEASMPPKYEAAIKRYYERLSQQGQVGR